MRNGIAGDGKYVYKTSISEHRFAVYMDDEIAQMLKEYMKNETRKWEAKHFGTLTAEEEEE